MKEHKVYFFWALISLTHLLTCFFVKLNLFFESIPGVISTLVFVFVFVSMQKFMYLPRKLSSRYVMYSAFLMSLLLCAFDSTSSTSLMAKAVMTLKTTMEAQMQKKKKRM